MIKGQDLIHSLREASAHKFPHMSAAGGWIMEVSGGAHTPFMKFMNIITVKSTAEAITLRGAQETAWKQLIAGIKAKNAAKVKAAAKALGDSTAPPKPPRSAKPPKPPKPPRKPKPPKPPKPPRKPKPPKPQRSSGDYGEWAEVAAEDGEGPLAGRRRKKWPKFSAAKVKGSNELARSRKRWNDAVDRGKSPVTATITRIKATKAVPKLVGIKGMLDELVSMISAADHKKLWSAWVAVYPGQAAAPAPKPPRSAKPPATRKPRKPKPKIKPRPARQPRPSAASARRAAAEAVIKQTVVEAVSIVAKGTATGGKRKVRFDLKLTPTK
jgi:outer membrane biosynthesis protein TonB